MNSRQKAFVVYSVLTTLAWLFLIFIVSMFFTANLGSSDLVIFGEKIGYMLAFAILCLLIYRTIIVFIKVKVEKIAVWHTQIGLDAVLTTSHSDIGLINVFCGSVCFA